jgi:hypothetical protein
MFIPNPVPSPSQLPDPDPGVKKHWIPDPDLQHWTKLH